ncbi:MAG TPA: response regulator [Methanomicrobia archaeon]|nr:response regulator [Methanomicrobia archaeon]
MTTVLIVDDEEDIRFIYTRALGKRHDVLAAENGQKAIDLYKQHSPDIVIMDSRMPDMEGIEATREIISHDAQARIIGATGYSDLSSAFKEAGAVSVIEKPFSLETLMKTVEKYIVDDV